MMNLRIPISLKQNGPISSPFVVPKKRHNTLWQNLYDFCSRVHVIPSSLEGAEIESHMFELSLLIFFLLYFSLILHIFSFLSIFMLRYCWIGVEILNVINIPLSNFRLGWSVGFANIMAIYYRGPALYL